MKAKEKIVLFDEKRTKAHRRLFMKTDYMMDSLLTLAVKKGELTYQELNEAFPAEFFPLDELERFLHLLDDLGVKVVDSEKQRKKKARRSNS